MQDFPLQWCKTNQTLHIMWPGQAKVQRGAVQDLPHQENVPVTGMREISKEIDRFFM